MFSSSNGISSFAQLSPFLNTSTGSTSTHSFGLNDNEALLHHHQDLLSHYFAVAPITEAANMMMASSKKVTITSMKNHPEILTPNKEHCRAPYCGNQPAVKRDRHSKIFTAQGPRDRRVRLSMDIAAKFFGLHDLLGFDKASQTLDWLLTNSKQAIKELLETNDVDDGNANAKCLRSLAGGGNFVTRLTSEEAVNGDSKRTTASKKKRKPAKRKGAKDPEIAAIDKLAKESRANARERARKRTREKISLRKLFEDQKLPDLISFSPNQAKPWSQNGSKTSDSSSHNSMPSLNLNTEVDGFFFFNPGTGKVEKEEIFQESVRIKRKLKPSSFFGFQRNLILSKDASSNRNNFPPVTNENWGISSSMTLPTFCAVTNMSSSKVLQVWGKPWEDQSNNNHVQCGAQIN